VHKSGKWLLSANYNDGKLGVIAIGDDGKLGATTSIAAGGQAHMALDDGASGGFVFVPCKAAGHVAMFKFNTATGSISANSPATVPVGNGPRHMAFNPNGKFAYVTQEGGTALVAFKYDSATGLLSSPMEFGGLPRDGAHVLVHPSGTFVYHIARGGNAVTVLKVAEDGALSKASSVTSGGYDATMTKDGKYLIVVSGANVRVYSIDPATGGLTATGTGQAVNGSQSVAVSP
jgi:6-phosphogluconolactonase (cycloisomerase 2 family)